MYSLLLISLGVTSLSSFYYCLRAFAVRWLCLRILGDKVQFVQPQHTQENCYDHTTKSGRIERARANGYHQTTVNGTSVDNGTVTHRDMDHGVSGDKAWKERVVVLTEGDVAEISQLIVGQVVGVSSSVASIIIMWQTRHDVIHGISWLLAPFSHLFAWYFLLDLWAMLHSFTLRKNLTSVSLPRRLKMFVLKKWAHVIHHLLIFFLAYPMTVNYSLRGYMGDFILGALMAEDFSTPLVSFAKILKLLELHNTTLYKINGLILVPIFFVARILNIPLAFLAYAAQYHSWDILAAAKSMTLFCHICNIGQWLLQLYWFSAIVSILTGAVRTYIKTKWS